jgi:hypothetical protein
VFGCDRSGAAGAAAQKLDANKIAEIESKALARVTWRADARAELFLRFFILGEDEGTPGERFTKAAG